MMVLIKKHPLILLIVVAVSWIYFHSLTNDYVNLDDGPQVYFNEDVVDFKSSSVKNFFTGSVMGMYQPATSSSFGIIANFFGVKSATPFHVFSFLFHILNLLLVYIIGFKIFDHKIKAFFLTALFALHPSTVESVSWVSATSTVLFTFFFLLATYFYLQFLESNKKKYYVYCLVSFTVGCFTKSQIIPFVGAIVLLDYLYKKPLLNRKSVFQKIPFLAVGIIFGLLTIHFRSASVDANTISLFEKLYFSANQISWYVIHLFLPIENTISYQWPKVFSKLDHVYSFALIPLLFSAFYFRNKNRLFTFGILFFLVNIILQTSFFSVLFGPYAVRYTYLSGIGIWVALLSFSYKKQFVYVGIFCLGVFIILAKQQTEVWEDSESLYKNSLKFSKDIGYVYSNLANHYRDNDKKKEAIINYQKSLVIEPDNAGINTNLGMLLMETQPKKAEKHLLRAIKKEPKALAYQQIGYLYARYMKPPDFQKAEKYLLKATKLNPKDHLSYNRLGSIFMSMNPKKAEGFFLKSISVTENPASYNNLAILNLVHFKPPNKEKAEKYFLKAAELDPSEETYGALLHFYKDFNPKKAKEYEQKIRRLKGRKK